jgi:hypothetical protein
MDVGRLEEIVAAASGALRARRAAETPPPAVLEEMGRRNAQRAAAAKMTAADWGRSFTFTEAELGPLPTLIKPGFDRALYDLLFPKTKPPG